jgi:transcriptional regulator with XRE-family HTH domain
MLQSSAFEELTMDNLPDLRKELMRDPAFRASYEERTKLVRYGHMVRRAREAKRLTQTELAALLKTTQSEISRLENGEGVNGPTFETMVSVAHALGSALVVGFSEEPAPGEQEPERRQPDTGRAAQSHGTAPGHPDRERRRAEMADALTVWEGESF